MHLDGFWVLQSNEMPPQILSNKYIMFGRDGEINDERIGEDCEEIVKI